jgi:hypothetical protein
MRGGLAVRARPDRSALGTKTGLDSLPVPILALTTLRELATADSDLGNASVVPRLKGLHDSIAEHTDDDTQEDDTCGRNESQISK